MIITSRVLIVQGEAGGFYRGILTGSFAGVASSSRFWERTAEQEVPFSFPGVSLSFVEVSLLVFWGVQEILLVAGKVL
ncbi:MAG: hypothetical protein ACE5GN_02965 [Waddliaceae bacterium]